jgi:glutamate dehydrogenase (NAD(P)+)
MDMDLHCKIDELGPVKVLVVREPSIGLLGYAVVDNVAAGPAIGGVRMATDVDLAEVARLARAMSFKNAAAGLPHGGAKAGIVADPKRPLAEREALVRAFARGIRGLTDYIPGPDMGTNEVAMAWVHDEIGRAAGLPRVVGGIPLDEIGATGLGVAAAADVVAERTGLSLDGARVAVQGFGAVGIWASRYLAERGARLVAASDSRGAVHNADGLDIEALVAHKKTGHSVSSFEGGDAIEGADLVGVDCEIWVPAARPDVLTADNISQLRAKVVLQGANIPATAEAEAWMEAHGVVNVPDFICNAGGVICAAFEYGGGTEAQARAFIVDKVRANVAELLDRRERDGVSFRQAAIDLAETRVREAMSYRRP